MVSGHLLRDTLATASKGCHFVAGSTLEPIARTSTNNGLDTLANSSDRLSH